jgi:RNA recognition motif-containing protein
MYTDDDGKFKGEALVVYFRPESVNLAIQMLDDSDFRLGETGPQGPMRVQAADFSFKSQQEAPTKTSMRDKKKIIKRTQKLNKYASHRSFIWRLLTKTVNSRIGMTTIQLRWWIRTHGLRKLWFSSTCLRLKSWM